MKNLAALLVAGACCCATVVGFRLFDTNRSVPATQAEMENELEFEVWPNDDSYSRFYREQYSDEGLREFVLECAQNATGLDVRAVLANKADDAESIQSQLLIVETFEPCREKYIGNIHDQYEQNTAEKNILDVSRD